MKLALDVFGQKKLPCLIALTFGVMLTAAPGVSRADEREDLEKLRATVLSLIDVLVKNKIVPKDKADAMMREAQAQANNRLAQLPPPQTGPDGKKVVRVPYVPEAIKVQMREEIKAEVLAETRKQNNNSGVLTADGKSRLQIDGDLRIRVEEIRPSPGNTSPQQIYANNISGPLLTRAPDPGTASTATTPFMPNYNTQDNVSRTRLRARLGLTALLSDSVTAGFGLATGNITGPTSTNQTIGQGSSQSPGYFNKYSVVVDRAYIQYQPTPWASLSAGRFRNPFVGTDLVWADDLNFEGFAGTLKPTLGDSIDTYLTMGWFPLTTHVPDQVAKRSLKAVQAGMDWKLGTKDNHFKIAAAYYNYNGIEGQAEKLYTAGSQPPDYARRSEYGSAYRQRGNTLFAVNAAAFNAAGGNTAAVWGLASSFHEIDLTSTLDLVLSDPMHLVLTGDVVYNRGFKKAEIAQRTGVQVTDGSGLGYLARALVGVPTIAKRGQWNASVAYRRLGSDAVLDAFTNSDFGMGGTNNKGFVVGMNYGIAPNTWLSARWMSSKLIDSLSPATSAGSTPTRLSVDTFQLDLNARF